MAKRAYWKDFQRDQSQEERARRAKAYGKQANANHDNLTTTGSPIRIPTTGESIGLDAVGMGWGGMPEATIERGSATTDGETEAGIRRRWEVIDVYTINKRYGKPIEKRKALKVTDKTVTFENGRRENLSNDYRSHFATLDEAIEFFNQFHSQRRSSLESELKFMDNRADDFFDFVWKERGYK